MQKIIKVFIRRCRYIIIKMLENKKKSIKSSNKNRGKNEKVKRRTKIGSKINGAARVFQTGKAGRSYFF